MVKPVFFLMQADSRLVALMRCPNYRSPSLLETIDQVLAAIGCQQDLSSCRVLLKPNLISAGSGPLACTEGRFMVAVATWFIEHGASVSLGDSPAFGTAAGVLARLGCDGELRKIGVRITPFSQVEKVCLASGMEAGIATPVLACDLLVNLPRIKAHAQTRLTMAVKNCFGCLVGLRKPWWHMAHGGSGGRFADLLVELLSVLPASLTLVDGIVAMHETGPVRGRPYPLSLVAGGSDPVAVDTALLALLAVNPESSPLWQACRRAEKAALFPEELVFPLLRPEDLKVSDFVVPTDLNPIRFNPFRFIRSSIKRMLIHC